MPILQDTLRKTTRAAHAAATLFSSDDIHHPSADFMGGTIVAAVSVGAFTAFLAGETGAAILGELRRRRRLREPHPKSPSLRGAPTSKELAADIAISPRTLPVRLRLGSRLADLEPTLDNHVRYTVSATGAKRIRDRGRGMKGYLADNRIPLHYSTLLLYMRLATRLRRLLGLDARLPLEWLLPGSAPDRELPSGLRTQYATARRRLARLLREHRNFSRLRRHVDKELGIPQLLTARRAARLAAPIASRPRATRIPRPTAFQYALGSWLSLMDTELLDATRRAVAGFLRERDLPPKLSRLRDEAIRLLGGMQKGG